MWETRILARTGEDLLEYQPPTATQDTTLFEDKLLLVGNIRAGVLSPEHIKAFISEWHRQSATQVELNRILKATLSVSARPAWMKDSVGSSTVTRQPNSVARVRSAETTAQVEHLLPIGRSPNVPEPVFHGAPPSNWSTFPMSS